MIQTMTHEIGHAMMGNQPSNIGHPDEGAGPAPLRGSQVKERLLYSTNGTPVTARPKRLVKAEWEEMRLWLIQRVEDPFRTNPGTFQ